MKKACVRLVQSTYTDMHMCRSMPTCTPTFLHKQTLSHTSSHVHKHFDTHAHSHTQVHTHTHTHMQQHTHMCRCIISCRCIFMLQRPLPIRYQLHVSVVACLSGSMSEWLVQRHPLRVLKSFKCVFFGKPKMLP